MKRNKLWRMFGASITLALAFALVAVMPTFAAPTQEDWAAVLASPYFNHHHPADFGWSDQTFTTATDAGIFVGDRLNFGGGTSWASEHVTVSIDIAGLRARYQAETGAATPPTIIIVGETDSPGHTNVQLQGISGEIVTMDGAVFTITVPGDSAFGTIWPNSENWFTHPFISQGGGGAVIGDTLLVSDVRVGSVSIFGLLGIIEEEEEEYDCEYCEDSGDCCVECGAECEDGCDYDDCTWDDDDNDDFFCEECGDPTCVHPGCDEGWGDYRAWLSWTKNNELTSETAPQYWQDWADQQAFDAWTKDGELAAEEAEDYWRNWQEYSEFAAWRDWLIASGCEPQCDGDDCDFPYCPGADE
jgi:hypothetical protein